MFLGLAAVILFVLIFNIFGLKQGRSASFIPSEQNFEDWSGQGGAILEGNGTFSEIGQDNLENFPPGPYTQDLSNYLEINNQPLPESEFAGFLQEDSLVNILSPFDFKPSTREGIITYAVKEGDNPWAIAASFGISVETILWANNLKETTVIKPGDQLEILPLSGVKYKIKRGENLSSVVKKYKGDLVLSLKINNLSEDSILEEEKTIIIAEGKMPAPVVPAPAKPAPTQTIAQANVSGAYFAYPTSGRNWGRIHGYNGVDISNSCGTPIYASAPGQVTESDGSGWNGGYGKVIKISHPNGLVTLYAHNSQLLVSYGDNVIKGQLIAYMGSTGRSTGCHLHFEVRGARNPLAR